MKYVRLFIGTAISVVLIVLLVRAVNGQDLLTALGHASPVSLLLALGLYAAAAWLRSVRWGLLLPRNTGSTSTLLRALLVGFTVNNLLPARLGEAARAFVLKQWLNVPVGVTIASVVVERILDGLVLAALLLIAIGLLPGAPSYLLAVGLLVSGVFAGGALLVTGIIWRPAVVLTAMRIMTRPCPPPARALAERLTHGFIDGLALVHGWRLLAQLVALSSGAWLLETGVFFVLMFGFAIPGSLALAILGGSAANFATLVPSSPGYVGTFDGVLVKVMTDVLGQAVSYEEVLAYALVVRAVLFLPVTVAGLVVLWRANLSFGEVIRFGASRSRASEVEGEPTAVYQRDLGSSALGIGSASADQRG